MSARTEQQLGAVAERGRDVFLRAGAGTGKTTVLVDRFCAAARDPDSGVEQILAFTFTERAADQLRRRVREELNRRAAAAEGEERETLFAAAEASDRAWISTIHGFCRRLLASHPAAAGLDPRFRVVDEPEADRLASRAFESGLEEMVEAGGAEALELAAANRPRTLLQMTRGAYDELRSHGDAEPVLPELPPPDTRAAITALVDAARAAHEECAEAEGKSVASRDRIAAAAELDPSSEPGEELLRALAGMQITSGAKEFKGEACERYGVALKRARAAVAAGVLGPLVAVGPVVGAGSFPLGIRVLGVPPCVTPPVEVLAGAEAAARGLGVRLQFVEASRDPADVDRAFSDMTRAQELMRVYELQGLGTVPLGAFDDAALKDVLGGRLHGAEPLYALAVGSRREPRDGGE